MDTISSMTTAIILAVAIVVVVGLVTWFLVARGVFDFGDGGGTKADEATRVSEKGSQSSAAKASVTELDPRARKREKPKQKQRDADPASVVEAAEAILKAEGTLPPKPPAPDEDSGDGAGDEPDAAVGLLEREKEAEEAEEEVVEEAELPVEAAEKPSFRARLGRTRKAMSERFADVRLRRKIDDEVWDELEEALILADVGADLAIELVGEAREAARDDKAETPDEVIEALKSVLAGRLEGRSRDLTRSDAGPTVWLVVGVNGTGKTTTIGKLAAEHAEAGEEVVVAAADTFRAAAADQLEIWAQRCGAEIVKGQEGADPGAIVFDAVSYSRAHDSSLLLVDTAGRLHTKVNLMEELKKIRRVAENAGGTPDEVLLVVDATTGQNGLIQAREFAGATGVSGVVLTKLDGTAKGGIAFAIEQEFDIPIKLVGLGEGAADLVAFEPDEFVDALFD